MNLSVYTEVGDRGWAVSKMILPVSGTDTYIKLGLSVARESCAVPIPIRSITRTEDGLCIEPASPFCYNSDFMLEGFVGNTEVSLSKRDVSCAEVKDLDKFEPKTENNVIYRLYSPVSSAPRPLILFLHGGGECGYDNLMQMTGTLGAMKLAQTFPDMYVMAPQAPGRPFDMLPETSAVFSPSFDEVKQDSDTGWNRKYLAAVCDIIYNMIAEGKADPNRIYVIGMSMGGAGALRALSAGNGLFAAAAPICPTMMPETYRILCSLTRTSIWISTAYADHTLYRHKYIVDGILHLKEAGSQNAHLTLYSPEEMKKYGFSTAPSLSLQERLSENHYSWVPTLHNEYGILDWLVSQHK